jgi:hypothetical protein
MLCDYHCEEQDGKHDCTCVACGHSMRVSLLPVRRMCRSQTARTRSGGPGTELSKLLRRFGIDPSPTCDCRRMASAMDFWGPDECDKPERIEEVLAVMREEAAKRGLPFLDTAGRLLVKRAIRNARKAAS